MTDYFRRSWAVSPPVLISLVLLLATTAAAMVILPSIAIKGPASDFTSQANDLQTARNGLRGTVLQSAAGIVLILGALATWRSLEVKGADLVKVHLLHGRVVNRRLGLREPLEQVHRALLALGLERRAPNPVDDAFEVVVRVALRRVLGVLRVLRVLGVLTETELGCADAGAAHALGAEVAVLDRQAAEGALQRVQRQPEIEERAQDHVTGGAREAV